MEHEIPFGNSNRENGTTFLDFPLFLGIFQRNEPTKRVPFTAEPEIPEILSKWKAPNITVFFCVVEWTSSTILQRLADQSNSSLHLWREDRQQMCHA